jgi:flagellar biosynthesis/type III secretory pathway protein FliH
VASVDSKGDLSNFSNYGQDSVDIAAPGNNIAVATVERISVPSLATEADGQVWREELWWLDSISKTWGRNFYSSGYWLESPRNYSSWSALTAPVFDLSQRYDPRMKISLDFELGFGGGAYLSVSGDSMNWTTLEHFTYYATSGERVFEFDVSKWAGDDSLWVKFDFFPESNLEYFDIGPIRIEDISPQTWTGTPYYDFAQGTSFAAPVVSGVASLVMSHRPDLLASDVKEILMNSVQTLNSLSNKVKSGGIVRADNALELADTYRRRSSVEFMPTYNQQITSDLKVMINDIYLTYQEMTAGVLVGKGDYFEGDSITLKAMPEVGFNFEGWEESGEIISTDATYTFTSEFKDYVFKAIFTEDLSDPDNDEFPNYAEALYGTDIENPNSDNDALNDYDEWQVGWYGSSLRLLEDDSETISLLEDILGKDSYKKGELAGIEKGKTSVTTDPSAYNLVTKTTFDQALLDATKTAEQAIANAKSEGENSVTSNPSAFNLVTKTTFDQALLDANASAKQAITDAKVLAKAEGIEEGKTLGISEGESSVISNPSVYNLVTKSSYDQALLDANATAEQAIANAQVSAKAEGIKEGKAIGKSEGQSSVTSNPTAYNLVTQVAYDQMMNDLMSAFDSNATHYTEGWFYHPGRGWMWTTFSAYPYFYDATDKDWIYFHSGNEKPKFYRYKTKTWLTIE